MKKVMLFAVVILNIFTLSCSNQIAQKAEEHPDDIIHGYTAPGFERMRTVFTRNFIDGKETGAALCVYYRNEKVVDLWGGYRDNGNQHLWRESTMTLVYSMTKGLASLCIAKLHSDSLIDYDMPIAAYWPEFGVNGKERITIRQLLSHQSGLCLWEGSVPVSQLNDPDVIIPKLVNAKPYWMPGERSGYSAGIVGAYMREIVQRCDPKHRSLGRYFREEIAQPVNAEFYIGLPDSIPDERVAYNTVLGVPQRLASMFKLPWGMFTTVIDPWSIFMKSISQVEGYDVNSRTTWKIEEPSGNGIGTARGAARIYSEFANGGTAYSLRKRTLRELEGEGLQPANGSVDMVMGIEMHYRNGFLKNGLEDRPFENPRCYGFGGASGSMAFADPVHTVGYCYIPTLMGDDFPDSRNALLQTTLYECIASLSDRNVPAP